MFRPNSHPAMATRPVSTNTVSTQNVSTRRERCRARANSSMSIPANCLGGVSYSSGSSGSSVSSLRTTSVSASSPNAATGCQSCGPRVNCRVGRRTGGPADACCTELFGAGTRNCGRANCSAIASNSAPIAAASLKRASASRAVARAMNSSNWPGTPSITELGAGTSWSRR